MISLLISEHKRCSGINPFVKMSDICMIGSVEITLNALAARQLVTAHDLPENAIFHYEFADRALGA